MLRCTVLRLLLVAAALAPIASAAAYAAALVGKTEHIQPASVPVPAIDQMKAEYRRPDVIPFPPADRYTPENALLGRTLYYDTRLSAAGALACASCHNPGFGFGDGLPKSIGSDTLPLDRRSPSLLNAAWGVLFMWDGRAGSLEEQAIIPIEGKLEMNQPMERLVRTLSTIQGYQPLFQAAFSYRGITPATITAALATYERTIVSAAAPFDAWVEGDESAIPDAAKRGFRLFSTRAECSSCHAGWLLTDDGFHDTGLPDDDLGRGKLLPRVVAMQHAFKTPGLREITLRAPYMHDGSLPTLEAVVAHYNRGGVNRPSQSDLVTPLGLSADEQSDIVAFLRTLTSSVVPLSIPVMPR